MFAYRIPSNKLHTARLDTDYYNPEALHAEDELENIETIKLESAGEVWNFGAYELCNLIEQSKEPDAPVFIAITNIDEPFIELSQCQRVTDKTLEVLHVAAVSPGDILVSIAGSIGKCGMVPHHNQRGACANQAIAKFRCKVGDKHFALAYFMSKQFKLLLGRQAGGAVQKNLYLHNFLKLPLLKPHPDAQAYIGNKVRQAEALRARARELQNSITQQLQQAFQPEAMIGTRLYSRTLPEEIGHRLDPKYYGPIPQNIRRSLRGNSTKIAGLQPEVSNGFECREFVPTGRPYITVGDVSSGRLELQNAPMISWSVSVPDKATINERCVLVVRTGSIGTAIQPLPEDSNAAISSHLVRLIFPSQEIAAAVAVFLSSQEGKLLQLACSYGAVQPQISQDELVEIPIPNEVLALGGVIFATKRRFEHTTRYASSLTSAAKYLVEALIERKVTEAELIAANNDPSADRELMKKLTVDGFDVSGAAPLFDDLDRLQELLDEANSAGGSDEV